MKIQVAPFFVPAAETILHRGWSLSPPQGRVALTQILKPWDYQTKLRLIADLSVDRAAVIAQAHLSNTSVFEILVMVRSSTTKVERNVLRLELPAAPHSDLACEFVLNGQDMGGRLTIETLLVCSVPVTLDNLAPSDSGSILWRHSQSTYLEGVEGQFPTDAEDFKITRPGSARAGWALHVDAADADALFTSAVRLTMNSGLPAVQRLLVGATDPSTVLLAAALDVDVTRQLIAFGLRTDEVYLSDVDHESKTLAGVIRSLIAQLWPGVSPVTLRAWMRDTPEKVELEIQNSRSFPS